MPPNVVWFSKIGAQCVEQSASYGLLVAHETVWLRPPHVSNQRRTSWAL